MLHTMATMRRTGWIARLVLTVAVAVMLGTMVVPEVEAKKLDKNTIARVINKRARNEARICEQAGGNATITKGAGKSKTVSCTDLPNQVPEGSDGYSCTFHSKGVRCHAIRTGQSQGTTAPPPTGGLQEDPTGGGDGTNAGGGSVVPPPSEANPDGGDDEPGIR